ncbi:MAG: hypothetical protein K9W43_07055 [Candidatus Thorarchaeota archaeon]|nr:hypothetical protein [Candidatus Thorarchaeota archaeon]
MFVLGSRYYLYIPILADMGLIGALTLGSLLTLLFMGIGWLYDEKAKMWSQQVQATTERSPYQYVSNYKGYAFDYPVFYGFLMVMRDVLKKMNLSTDAIQDCIVYLNSYFKRGLSKHDINSALPAAKEYITAHPFTGDIEPHEKPISLRARIKLSFQINLLRLTWIQSSTGLVQDVLVFGVSYVILLVPSANLTVDDALSFEYLVLGLLFISLPLFLLLVTLGWIYDRRLRIWSPDMIVKFERNPYQYLPEPYLHIMLFPVYIALFNTFRKVFLKEGLDTSSIDKILTYLQQYAALDVGHTKDMQKARDLRNSLGVLFG